MLKMAQKSVKKKKLKKPVSTSIDKDISQKYKYLLDDHEAIKHVFEIGFFTLVLTNNRIVLKKKISHSLQSFKFKDIELVEYITEARWIFAVLSIILFVSAFLFLVSIPEAGVFTVMNYKVQGGVITSTQSNASLSLFIFELIGFIAFLFGVFFFFKFLYSLFGKLKIVLLNGKNTIEVICKFDDEIPKIINHIERKT